jgi:CHAT domain-containing protein/Tfp pilus assembly protein PilF
VVIRVVLYLGVLLFVSAGAVHAQDTAASARALADRLLAAPRQDWTRLADAPDATTTAVAEALVASGDQARLASEFTRAAAIYDIAQRVARRASAPAILGSALNGAADAWFRQGEFEPTLTAARESVAVHEREQLPAGLAQAWNTIGNVHQGRGEYLQALECYEKSLALREPLGDRRGIGQSLNNIGMVHKGLGHFPEALDHFRRALAVFEEIGERRPAAIVADNIGVVHFHQGDYGPALTYTRRALDANEAAGNRYGIAKSFDTLGNIYRVQGAYPRALEAFRKALAIRQDINDRHSVAETTNNIGLVHFSQGDYAGAIQAFARALRLNAKIGDMSLSSEGLLNLGAAAWKRREYRRAEANLRAGLAIAEREGYDHLTAEIRHDLGEIALARGRLAAADDLFAQALALRERIKDQAGITSTLTAMASARLVANRVPEALTLGQRAVDTAATYGQPELLWEAKTVVGTAQRRLGRVDDARTALIEAIEGVERLRRQVIGDPTRRAQFFEARLSPYHELIGLAADRRTGVEALEIAERAKARALVDLLRKGSFDERAAAEPAGSATPFRLEDAARLVRDESIAVVEYVVGPARAYALTLTRERTGLTVSVAGLPVGGRTLATLAERFRARVAARDLLYADDAKRLHTLLLQPLRRQLEGKRRLVIVPDGALWNVPFQALQDARGRFLIESMAVSYAPSLTAVREILRKPDVPDTLAVLAMGKEDFTPAGVPPASMLARAPLPDAGRQVRLIQGLYEPGRAAAYLGDDASEDRFKREAPRYPVLHLATHGVLDEASPLYSHVVLTPGSPREDGLLEAWEIMRLTLDAEVVVLSACETGRGRIAPGEGVIGMMWALFAAGTRSMVVSQWQVESASTTRLMTAFHRGLAAGHGSKAELLRTASLELLRSAEHAHPFYWAGFVLVGKP